MATAPEPPQAQNLVRQQMMQQQEQRNSPMRQLNAQATNQANQQTRPAAARWMSSQPVQKEQPEWARGGDNDGNIVPSSLNRMKSPPPPAQQSQQQYQQYQPPASNGNAIYNQQPTSGQNYGASMHAAPLGLRLQINANPNMSSNNTNNSSNAPRVSKK